MDLLCFFLSCVCYAFVRVCFMVTCWERTELLALVCGVLLRVCPFPIGILGQVWYLIVSIPDLCTLTFFKSLLRHGLSNPEFYGDLVYKLTKLLALIIFPPSL